MAKYLIVTPPILVTVEPGKEQPLTPPVTEEIWEGEVELSDADAEALLPTGVIRAIAAPKAAETKRAGRPPKDSE